MLLRNVSLYGKEGLWCVRVQKGLITEIVNAGGDPAKDELTIDAKQGLLLPGFINSHEHLDFNAFPRIGNKRYSNYKEWGEDIHQNNKTLINCVLAIPQALRVRWGLYRNLLNGFTTVVNHGAKLSIPGKWMHIIQKFPPIHSVAFEKGWKRKLFNPFRGKTVVMHLGEGVDEMAAREIGQVIAANVFRKRIIAVHGIAMNAEQAGSFGGLVWCPSSNYFLFGSTANVASLRGKIPIAFGTDSTLTSSWDLWSQLREVSQKGEASEEELMSMLTDIPAGIWNLERTGRIRPQYLGDLLLLNKRDGIFKSSPADILLSARKGEINLVDDDVRRHHGIPVAGFSAISFEGKQKWVRGDLPSLVNEMKKYYPELIVPFEIPND